MGLARDLTMGTRRRSSARIGTTGDFGLLRRLIAAADPDLTEMRNAIERVGSSPNRLRMAEGRIYNDACRRYRELTGEKVGPETILR